MMNMPVAWHGSLKDLAWNPEATCIFLREVGIPMAQPRPLRTTVIGSYPFPGWLEMARENLEQLGSEDLAEMRRDAVLVAVQDQLQAGLDVITDGEQGRFDFNLSFYAFLSGIEPASSPVRRFGPPAHDQRDRYQVVGPIAAAAGLGAVAEYQRLVELAPDTVTLKASVPGPYTLSGRLIPSPQYPDRHALTEALLPIVRDELEALVAAGCQEIALDEPSMSCYAWKEDTAWLVDVFNRTVEPVVGKGRLSTHLCFGNYKGHPVARRQYAPMFPEFLDLQVDEIHVEMANREFAELEIIAAIAGQKDVAVGIVDVKNYYIESAEDIVARVDRCLEHVPPERLALAPDCGLSQTARWAARQKLNQMVAGVQQVRDRLGV
jgi:5-methyltetrahydropteroyltriglutamate--homocysteine methyltransferase